VVPEHPCGDRGGISPDMGSGIGHPRVGKMNNDGERERPRHGIEGERNRRLGRWPNGFIFNF